MCLPRSLVPPFSLVLPSPHLLSLASPGPRFPCIPLLSPAPHPRTHPRPCMAGAPPARDQLLRLYRQILQAARRYPSIKREAVVQEIRAEFRANRVRDSVLACLLSSPRAFCCCMRRGLAGKIGDPGHPPPPTPPHTLACSRWQTPSSCGARWRLPCAAWSSCRRTLACRRGRPTGRCRSRAAASEGCEHSLPL